MVEDLHAGRAELRILGIHAGLDLGLVRDGVVAERLYETLAFAAKAATATIAGFDATDTLRFSASQFTGWQDVLAHASQRGADTVIRLDATHSITLSGVKLASLAKSEVAFA